MVTLGSIAVLACVVACGGRNSVCFSPSSDIELRPPALAELAPPPRSVDEFADRMTVVVRGAYAEVVEVLPSSGTEPWPITLMSFEIEDYIVGRGAEEIVVAQYGASSANQSPVATEPRFGETITLIAMPWERDSSNYVSVFGDFGRLTGDRDQVCYAFVDEERYARNPGLGSLPFAEGFSLDQLHESLRRAAAERGLFVPQD